jgi:hypothetical protein
MMSKSIEDLAKILALVGKEVPVKVLQKKKQEELDAAEAWAVTYNAKSQEGTPEVTKRVPKVPPMPEWLFNF